jgi:hypothetical protein
MVSRSFARLVDARPRLLFCPDDVSFEPRSLGCTVVGAGSTFGGV